MEPDREVSGFAAHLVRDFLQAHQFGNSAQAFSKECRDDMLTVKHFAGASKRMNLTPYLFTYLQQFEFEQTMQYLKATDGLSDSTDVTDWKLYQEQISKENQYRLAEKYSSSATNEKTFYMPRELVHESLLEILLDFWINASDRVRNALLDQSARRVHLNRKTNESQAKFKFESDKQNVKTGKKREKKGMLMAEMDAVFKDHVTIGNAKLGYGPAAPKPVDDEADEHLSPRSMRKKRAHMAKLEAAKAKLEKARLFKLSSMQKMTSDSSDGDGAAVKDTRGRKVSTLPKTEEELQLEDEKILKEIEDIKQTMKEKEEASAANLMRLRALQDWRKENFEFQFKKKNLDTDKAGLEISSRVMQSELAVIVKDLKEAARADKDRKRADRLSMSQEDRDEMDRELGVTPIVSMSPSRMLEIPPRPYGDQVLKECGLCTHQFIGTQMVGVTTFKSVYELRKAWGCPDQKNPMPTVPRCYDKVKLCRFCFQFFEVGEELRVQKIEEEKPPPTIKPVVARKNTNGEESENTSTADSSD